MAGQSFGGLLFLCTVPADRNMANRPKHDTLSRLLELLKALPHHGWTTPSELREQLANRGFDVDLRSVQRDLKELQKTFPLDHNDKGKPHGWRWANEAAGGIAAMGTPEALMIALVQKHLQAVLPATMLAGFDTLFIRARQKLDRLGPLSGAKQWPDKVHVVPPGMPVAAPSINDSVQRAVAEALLADRQIAALYTPGAKGRGRRYQLHPLGILLRGATSYLAATTGGNSPVRLYAMHRFREAQSSPLPSELPSGLNLTTALNKGLVQFGIQDLAQPPLNLVLRCAPVLSDLLEESPLGENQRLERLPDGGACVRVSVPDSWELRWWLLGRGAGLEVIEPATLRREIATAHRQAANRYTDP